MTPPVYFRNMVVNPWRRRARREEHTWTEEERHLLLEPALNPRHLGRVAGANDSRRALCCKSQSHPFRSTLRGAQAACAVTLRAGSALPLIA
jgi:hypothetical protein